MIWQSGVGRTVVVAGSEGQSSLYSGAEKGKTRLSRTLWKDLSKFQEHIFDDRTDIVYILNQMSFHIF